LKEKKKSEFLGGNVAELNQKISCFGINKKGDEEIEIN